MKRILLLLLLWALPGYGETAGNVVMEAWEAVSHNCVEISAHRTEWDAKKATAAQSFASPDKAHQAIREMLAGLHNSRLQWLSAEDVKSIVPELSGPPPKLGLAFLSFEFLPGKKKIIGPLWRSPAAEAGVRTGDELKSVNGALVETMSPGEVVRLLAEAGEKPAKFRVVRDGKPMDLEVNPAPMVIPFVTWGGTRDHMRQDVDITIREFTARAAQEFKETMEKLMSSPSAVERITIDLRNNPGGLLDVVREISAAFIGDKEFLCRKDASGKTKCEKTKAGTPVTVPVTVLVNEGTASAAEIFAAGFQRTHRGQVIGCRTYGHGFGGQLSPLSDGSAVLIPDTSYLDAKGLPIEGRGITPDRVKSPYVVECTKAN